MTVGNQVLSGRFHASFSRDCRLAIGVTSSSPLAGGEPPKTGDPPVFTEKAKIIPKDSGAIIVMECHVKSKTAPQFTWLHGSDPVKEDPHIKFNMAKEGTEDYVITLTITVGFLSQCLDRRLKSNRIKFTFMFIFTRCRGYG